MPGQNPLPERAGQRKLDLLGKGKQRGRNAKVGWEEIRGWRRELQGDDCVQNALSKTLRESIGMALKETRSFITKRERKEALQNFTR